MKNYQTLEVRFARIGKLNQMNAILSWDEQVNMPAGSGDSRAKVIAETELIIQEILLAPDTADLLNAAVTEELNAWQVANLVAMQKSYKNAIAVPPELNHACTLAIMKSTQVWRELRAKNDWQGFLPVFKEVVNLSKQRGEARAAVFGGSVYDALLSIYQENVSTVMLDRIFNDIKSWLPSLVTESITKQSIFSLPKGPFPIVTQKALGLEIMQNMGFDFNHGRLDISHHPFTGGAQSDVRITTRYCPDDFTKSLMGIIHETGHALYEQGLPHEWEFQPVGKDLGMMVHESQSLLFEMQVARSEKFLHYLATKIQQHFGNAPEFNPVNLVKLYQQVKPGYIRVDADEVTYPLHIILRYEIEQALMHGQIEVKDIPEIWDTKMQSYLGLSTTGNYKDGCMQDIHWPSGAFGYFPCYLLGAILSAQLFHSIKTEYADLDNNIANGDLHQIRNYLAKNIWSKASLVMPNKLIIDVTGEELSAKRFEQHLRTRYC